MPGMRLPGMVRRLRLTGRQAVQDLNRSLVLIVDPEALQASVAARLQELTGADRVVIFQLEPEKAELAPTFTAGVEREAVKDLRFGTRGRLARWLLTNESCLVLSRAPGVYEYLDQAEQTLLAGLGIRACIPLVSLNRLAGLVLLGSAHPGWDLPPAALELLPALAAQAGLAFENAHLNREQRDRLRRLDRAERLAVAGQLAAGVAHEIRNPLTSIRSTIQYLLADYPETSPKRALAEGLLSEVDRIDRTVGGLLNLTRRADLELSDLDLGELLDQTLRLLAPQAQQQAVALVREAWEPGLRVRGDQGQLKQVFLNLGLNALQAMPKGGRLAISLSATRSALSGEASRRALVRLEDDGVGIPPEHLERIFDPFFTTKREGTGLGLSLSYWIVQRHDGELDLSSQPGRGTTVSVRLPLASGGETE